MLKTPDEFDINYKPDELPKNVERLIKAPSYYEGENENENIDLPEEPLSPRSPSKKKKLPNKLHNKNEM